MQSNRMSSPDEPSAYKSLNKKTIISQDDLNMKGFQEPSPPLPTKSGKKVSKKVSNNKSSAISQQPENYSSGDEYWALRKKYLLLEEKSYVIGKELIEVENEVKTLEEEKLALLDELVVLEGLIDPSELQAHRFS